MKKIIARMVLGVVGIWVVVQTISKFFSNKLAINVGAYLVTVGILIGVVKILEWAWDNA